MTHVVVPATFRRRTCARARRTMPTVRASEDNAARIAHTFSGKSFTIDRPSDTPPAVCHQRLCAGLLRLPRGVRPARSFTSRDTLRTRTVSGAAGFA